MPIASAPGHQRRDGARAAYRAAAARRVAERAPIASAILLACAASATLFELIRFPERTWTMLATDVWLAALVATALWLAHRRQQDAPAIMVAVVNAVGLTLGVYHAAVGAPPAMCIWTLTALLATTAGILPWGWRHQAAASVGAVLGYTLLLDPGSPDAWAWGAGATYLAWVVALATASAGLIDQYLRTDFELAAQLSEREARLQSYFDLALVGTAILSPDGRWMEVNDEFCRILGHERPVLLGTQWPDLVQRDDRAAERVLFAHALAPGHAGATGELRLVRRDGEVVHALVSLRGLPGAAGAVDHVMLLVQDVTERSRREAALRHAKEQAEAGQRTKSDFLALVSHELRTPMTIISGMTDVVLGGELAPEQRHCLQKTKEATSAMVTLVNEVLDLSRIEAGKLPLRPRPMELRPWLSNVLQPLAWLAEQRALLLDSTVDHHVPSELVNDPERLRQVVVNLVDNALKFTEHGGVLISVTPVDEGTIRLTVADTGIGIPADRHAAIFEAFTQLQAHHGRSARGSGLGLSICRRIVEMMGGTIAVESREGEGASFHVTLPVNVEVGRDAVGAA